ncbi:hypothetical protein V8B97DRAFT_2026246 [Scleroderma yunnanense]
MQPTTPLPESLFEQIIPKLITVLRHTQRSDSTVTPQAKQALLQANSTWSDTCCIHKDSSAELSEVIGSIFSWYRKLALAMVLLAIKWFRRGWTLQELLAPFFARDWSLYKDGALNHKEDSVDNARSRFQWVSGRFTTRPEDIAYSLLGIFGLHMPVLYGESAEIALGRLLAEVGQSSTFHSCFPATLTLYQTLPPSLSQLFSVDPRSWSYTRYIWNLFVPTPPHSARKIHWALSNLPCTQFIDPRLVLPCIVHRTQSITLIRVDTTTETHVHQIQAVGLEPIEITLSERFRILSRIGIRAPYVLIRPWHSNLLDPALFSALLLMALPHNEYRRVSSFCSIVARPTDSAGVLRIER